MLYSRRDEYLGGKILGMDKIRLNPNGTIPLRNGAISCDFCPCQQGLSEENTFIITKEEYENYYLGKYSFSFNLSASISESFDSSPDYTGSVDYTLNGQGPLYKIGESQGELCCSRTYSQRSPNSGEVSKINISGNVKTNSSDDGEYTGTFSGEDADAFSFDYFLRRDQSVYRIGFGFLFHLSPFADIEFTPNPLTSDSFSFDFGNGVFAQSPPDQIIGTGYIQNVNFTINENPMNFVRENSGAFWTHPEFYWRNADNYQNNSSINLQIIQQLI